MKQYLDYDGLTTYTKYVMNNVVKLNDNGRISEDVLPYGINDVIELPFVDKAEGLSSWDDGGLVDYICYYKDVKRIGGIKGDTIYWRFTDDQKYGIVTVNAPTGHVSNQTYIKPYEGKIYIDTSKQNSDLYRWNGENMYKISDTSTIDWSSINNKPNLVEDVVDVSSDNENVVINYKKAGVVKNSTVNIPCATHKTAGCVSADDYVHLGEWIAFYNSKWTDVLGDTNLVDMSKASVTNSDTQITINLPTKNPNGNKDNNLILQQATTSKAGIITASDKRLFNEYINHRGKNIIYSSIVYNSESVQLGYTLTDSGDGFDTNTLDINAATTSHAGMMSSDDKQKLDSIGPNIIFFDKYIDSATVLYQSAVIDSSDDRSSQQIVYVGSEGTFALLYKDTYYCGSNEILNTCSNVVMDSNMKPKRRPFKDTFYISTENYTMFVSDNGDKNILHLINTK